MPSISNIPKTCHATCLNFTWQLQSTRVARSPGGRLRFKLTAGCCHFVSSRPLLQRGKGDCLQKFRMRPEKAFFGNDCDATAVCIIRSKDLTARHSGGRCASKPFLPVQMRLLMCSDLHETLHPTSPLLHLFYLSEMLQPPEYFQMTHFQLEGNFQNIHVCWRVSIFILL